MFGKYIPDEDEKGPRQRGEESGFESEDDEDDQSGANPDTSGLTHVRKLGRDVAEDYINSMNSFRNLASSLQRIERKHPDHVPDDEQDGLDVTSSGTRRRCLRCVSAVVDLHLLKEPIFYIICVANVFAFLGAFIPLKFQVDRAMTFELSSNEAKTQEMASFLVSVSGKEAGCKTVIVRSVYLQVLCTILLQKRTCG